MRQTEGKWEKQLLGEKEKVGIAPYIRKRGSSQLQLQLWALWVHPKSGDTRTLLIINLSKPGHSGMNPIALFGGRGCNREALVPQHDWNWNSNDSECWEKRCLWVESTKVTSPHLPADYPFFFCTTLFCTLSAWQCLAFSRCLFA